MNIFLLMPSDKLVLLLWYCQLHGQCPFSQFRLQKQAGTYLNPNRAITAKHDMAKFRSHGHLGSHHYTIVHIILLIG